MCIRTRIKMCGTTSEEDARAAVAAGVDCLGFIFVAKSPRCISADHAANIIASLPPFVDRVGVFVNEKAETIMEIVKIAGLNGIQLHGDETPEFCHSLAKELPSVFLLKAFRVSTASLPSQFSGYADAVNGYLLDTYVKNQPGGTGIAFDWTVIEKLQLARPVILAGGLTPRNVRDALHTAGPYGVDVNSGVETTPGKKDHLLLRSFVEEVAGFDQSARDLTTGRR